MLTLLLRLDGAGRHTDEVWRMVEAVREEVWRGKKAARHSSELHRQLAEDK